MTRYARYKPTGISWLPEVPEGWEMVLNQFLFKENIRPPSQMDRPLSLSQVDGLLPTDDMKERSLKTSTYEGWKRVLKDDLVLNRFKAHLGVFFASKYEGMVSFHYGVFAKRRSLLPRYYEYLFHTPQYKFVYSWASKGMTIGLQNLSNTDFYKVRSPYPPEEEQRRIVSFLDSKCGKIDRLVAAKEKEVALLKELKQSMIAEAVTGRTNNQPMKPSGIPWLPEVPEGWKVRRLASLFCDDAKPNKDFVFTRAMKFNYGMLVPKNEIGEPEEYRDVYVKYSVLEKGDIVINGLNLNYDFNSLRVACSPCEGIITSAYIVCRPREGVDSSYFTYLFKAMDYCKMFHGMGTGIRLTLSFNELRGQMLPVPSHAEQREIVAYIEARAAKIDAAVSKLEAEVAALKEYRERLVADVVTGQRKVA